MSPKKGQPRVLHARQPGHVRLLQVEIRDFKRLERLPIFVPDRDLPDRRLLLKEGPEARR